MSSKFRSGLVHAGKEALIVMEKETNDVSLTHRFIKFS